MLDVFCCGERHARVTICYLFQVNWHGEQLNVVHLDVVVGFSLFNLSVAGEVVKSAVLHEGSKGKDETDGDKKVHGSHIGNFWKGLPGYGAQCCHC